MPGLFEIIYKDRGTKKVNQIKKDIPVVMIALRQQALEIVAKHLQDEIHQKFAGRADETLGKAIYSEPTVDKGNEHSIRVGIHFRGHYHGQDGYDVYPTKRAERALMALEAGEVQHSIVPVRKHILHWVNERGQDVWAHEVRHHKIRARHFARDAFSKSRGEIYMLYRSYFYANIIPLWKKGQPAIPPTKAARQINLGSQTFTSPGGAKLTISQKIGIIRGS